MQLIQSAYNLLHHSAELPPSQLDMALYAIKSIISAVGTFVILVGVLISLHRFFLLRFLPHRLKHKPHYGVNFIRRDLGQTLVLGLEFIIAADVVETTTTPDYYSVGILVIIVIIRTFLSYSLNREISQLSPAQKGKLSE